MLKLTAEDMKRIDKNAVKELIKHNEERLKVWSIPEYEKQEIRADIETLRNLLK